MPKAEVAPYNYYKGHPHMKLSFHVHPKSFTKESKQGIDKSRG